jgi:hypothetical protein
MFSINYTCVCPTLQTQVLKLNFGWYRTQFLYSSTIPEPIQYRFISSVNVSVEN